MLRVRDDSVLGKKGGEEEEKDEIKGLDIKTWQQGLIGVVITAKGTNPVQLVPYNPALLIYYLIHVSISLSVSVALSFMFLLHALSLSLSIYMCVALLSLARAFILPLPFYLRSEHVLERSSIPTLPML